MTQENQTNPTNPTVPSATQVQGSHSTQINPAPPAAPEGPQMPDGGVEKFWDAKGGTYNWEAHAKELAWQQRQKAGQPAPKADTPPPAEAQTNETAEQVAERAGVDIEAANRAIMETGKIDDANAEKLRAVGIPQDVIDNYARQVRDDAVQHANTVTEFIGAPLDKIREFVKGRYSDAEIQGFSEALSDPSRWRPLAAWLRDEMKLPAPQKGTMLHGDNAAAPSTQGLEPLTDDALQSAINSPKWKTDPAFRNGIINRARAAGLGRPDPRAHSGGM